MLEEKKGKEFEKLANPDVNGISKPIDVSNAPDFLKVTNGSSFSREGSYLDNKYWLNKKYEKGEVNTRIDNQKAGIGKGRLISIQLDGFREEK